MLYKFYAILLIILLTSCSKKDDTSVENSTTNSIVSETIDAHQFQNKMGSEGNVIILDVRTPGELSGGFIEGAINIDFKSDDFNSKIGEMDKDATYFVYCAGGGRSRNAADLMKDLKFKKVYDLKGGFTQWSAEGLPTKLP